MQKLYNDSLIISKNNQYNIRRNDAGKSACTLISLEAVYRFLFEDKTIESSNDMIQ